MKRYREEKETFCNVKYNTYFVYNTNDSESGRKNSVINRNKKGDMWRVFLASIPHQ